MGVTVIAAPKENPMMKQYDEIKNAHSECIVFFQLGGFYELFNLDAFIASQVLGLKITARKAGGTVVPQCGIPFSSADKHILTLSAQGYSVAVCSQVAGEPENAGVLNRAVTKTVFADAPADYASYAEDYAAFLPGFEEEAKIQAASRKSPTKTEPAFSPQECSILNELRGFDLALITPMDALNVLHKWKQTYGGQHDGL
jgi:DNA mismatch repair ATPase MutS